MSDVRLYDVLADMFIREGVDTCFSLLGDANMAWATRLADKGARLITVRDEHCAVAAAMAWSRATQRTGVATVTCGPGLTQILTALPAAVRARIPLIIFAGEAPLKSRWYNQAIEQRPFVEACGAVYHAIHAVDSAPRAVRDAFYQAHCEQRPVVLGVPMDLQKSVCNPSTEMASDLPSASLIPPVLPIHPDPEAVKRCLPVIKIARRIVILAGRGVLLSGAITACRQLADHLNAILATTLPARGLFHDHPHCIGIAGGFASDTAREYLQQADLVIAVGTRLAQHATDAGKLFSAEHVLHIDLEPRSLSQGRFVARYHLRADARTGVEALLEELGTSQQQPSTWPLDIIADQILSQPADSHHYDIKPGMLDPRSVVEALNSSLPNDWYMVNSSGHCSCFFAHMPGRPAERFLTIREFGAIGNGISFALGVAASDPGVPVVLFDGDGSLMMHIQELETLARHELPVLICVMNDGAYGSEVHKLNAEGLSTDGAVFGRPEFADIAQAFGARGHKVTNLADLPKLVNEFACDPVLTLFDFHVADNVASPVIRRSHKQVT